MQNLTKTNIDLILSLKNKPKHGQSFDRDIKRALNQLSPIVEGLNQSLGELAQTQAFDEVNEFITKFINNINILNNRYNSLTKTLKINEEQAVKYGFALEKIGQELKIAPDLIKAYTNELGKTIPGSIAALKANTDYSRALLKQQNYLRDQIGLSADQAAAIQRVSAASEKGAEGFEEYRKELEKESAQLEKTTGRVGISIRAFENLASAGSEISVAFGQSGAEIARAQQYADKLGASFKEIAGVSEKFLDIESSISNELELQLLGGKQINAEKFREAALNRDMETAAQELSNIIEAQGEAAIQNPILLESLSKTLGLSRDRIVEMYTALKEGEKLTGDMLEAESRMEEEERERNESLRGGTVDIRTAQEQGVRDLALAQSKALTDEVEAGGGIDARFDQQVKATTDAFAKGEIMAKQVAGVLTGLGDVASGAMLLSQAAESLQKLSTKFKEANFSADDITVTATGNVNVNSNMGKAQDLYVASDQQTVVTGPFGSFQLDPRDSLLAGNFDRPSTGGGSGGGNMKVAVNLAIGTQTLDQITAYVMDDNNRRMNA